MREKTSQIGEKYDFRGENFHRLLAFAVPKDATPQHFAEKTFMNSHKTTKFTKVFSLKSFPLYGMRKPGRWEAWGMRLAHLITPILEQQHQNDGHHHHNGYHNERIDQSN